MSKLDFKMKYREAFEGEVGLMQDKLHLEVDNEATPVQMQPRRVPVALKEPLKAELQRLETLGVIVRQDAPTEWVSPIVVAHKRNGNLRLLCHTWSRQQAICRYM